MKKCTVIALIQEKPIKSQQKKRRDNWNFLQPGSKPGHGASCIECGVEIPTGKFKLIRISF